MYPVYFCSFCRLDRVLYPVYNKTIKSGIQHRNKIWRSQITDNKIELLNKMLQSWGNLPIGTDGRTISTEIEAEQAKAEKADD